MKGSNHEAPRSMICMMAYVATAEHVNAFPCFLHCCLAAWERGLSRSLLYPSADMAWQQEVRIRTHVLLLQTCAFSDATLNPKMALEKFVRRLPHAMLPIKEAKLDDKRDSDQCLLLIAVAHVFPESQACRHLGIQPCLTHSVDMLCLALVVLARLCALTIIS